MSESKQEISIEDVQRLLDAEFPSPEKDLIKLSNLVAPTPPTERFAQIRMLVYEVDDLISQARWNIGQSLLLLNQYPQILDPNKGKDPIAAMRMPASAQLLLRGLIISPKRVLFDDLSEHWRGGTVAGWIFHMMIDDAVVRSISILDRLARLLCLVAEISFDKVYFRSGKLSKVHEKLQTPETQRLVEQAKNPLFDLILKYRDGWSHDKKAISRLAGLAPVDSYVDDAGQRGRIGHEEWTAEYLLALVNAAYQMVVNALHDVYLLCDKNIEKRN